MLPWKSCDVGDPVHSIQTPSLILDLDAFERNLDRLMAASKGLRVRPHAKSHKCPEIAKRQIERGAVGICCQKLSEAAVFVQAGIKDVLITNQMISPAKLERLAQLATQARVGVLVDHLEQVQALSKCMQNREGQAREGQIDVYIEVEVGGERCGVAPTAVLPLAQAILAADGLRFAGLHCYHGRAQHFRLQAERQAAIERAVDAVRQAKSSLESAHIDVPRVTGAGTGTFWYERDSGVYDEIQAGSYAFMDRDYGDNQIGEGDVVFENALFVMTTVTSLARAGHVIVDAGLKASSVDAGMPSVYQKPDWRYLKASDEHGVISLPAGQHLGLGDTLMLVPGHCDPTMNLYDDLVCIRNDRVHAIWPIQARGALL